MKKLLSIILALVTLLSVTTVMAGATDADVAETSATYYVSNTPFEDVANANIIGYLGDVDGSKSISILDATQVQLSLASIIALGNNAKLLADVDRSGDISILDATDIQCHLAQLETNSKVAHTLYEKKADTAKVAVYNQIVDYLKKYGKYSETNNLYQIEITEYVDGVPGDYFVFRWDIDDDEIDIMHMTDDAIIFLTVQPNENKDTYYSAKIYLAGTSTVFSDTIGRLSLEDTNTKDFNLRYYTHRGSATFEEAKPVIVDNIIVAVEYLDSLMGDELTGNLYDLF